MSYEKSRIEWAKRKHKEFVKYTWSEAHDFVDGIHLDAICNRIDKAIEDYRNGKSTFIVLAVPFRHGKSQLVSRYLPVNFIGKFPDADVIAASHSQTFSNKLSRYARKVFTSDKFRKVYPNVHLSKSSYRVDNWEIADTNGSTSWAGIKGGIAGSGYSLGILDDYLKDRQSAESEVVRESQWEWFTQMFLARRTPVSITMVISTPWHTDDIIGRIKTAMVEDSEFPKFEFMRFPGVKKEYKSGYLWPERFDQSWYKSQKSALGQYGFQSLMQCDPVQKGGNAFKVDRIKVVEELPAGLKWVRAWDLASSSKQKLKSNPDWTVGAMLAIDYVASPFADIKEKIPHIYLADINRFREEALKRNNTIKNISIDEKIRVGVESFGAYKDAFTTLRDILQGICTIDAMTLPGDKMVKAEPLEPIIEAGNFHMLKAEWNDEFLKEMAAFPSGDHDDQVDAVSVAYHMAKGTNFDFKGGVVISGR